MEINQRYTDKFRRDYDLVQRALKNDQQAYTQLLGFYHDSMFFMLNRMVSNESDAEDLTIEAFTKAFNNLEKYNSAYAFSTWLFKIATNNCIDFLRSNKNKNKNISIDQDAKGPDFFPESFHITALTQNPEERLIDTQKEQILRRVVEMLHPDNSKIVKMRYFDDLSYKDIAEKVGIPLGTVKARLYRAKKLMLEILKSSSDDFDF